MINIRSPNHIIPAHQSDDLPPAYTASSAENHSKTLLPPSYFEIKSSALSNNVPPTFNRNNNTCHVGSKSSINNNNSAASTIYSNPVLLIELSENRAYDLNDTVSGHVIFSPQHDCRLAAVHATLAGEERTSTRKNWITQTLLQHQLRLAKQALDFSSTKIYKRGEHYRFPFQICVPSEEITSNQQLLLPPTVGPSPENAYQAAEYPISVFYFVNAAVRIADETSSNGKAKIYNCESPRIINIQPSYPTQKLVETTLAKYVNNPLPSMSVEIGGSKAGPKSLAGLLKKTSPASSSDFGVLTVAATQSCLVLSRNQSDVTYLRLSLQYKHNHGASSAIAHAPKLQEVHAQLSAITTYAKPSNGKNESKKLETLVENIPLDQYSSQAPQWLAAPAATTPNVNCELEVPLSLPFDKDVVSNFQSVHVARKYKLALELQFVGGTRVKIELPVCVTSSLYI
jgi:hypothetical protein